MLITPTSQCQTTLDETFATQQRVASFSTRGLINHLVELIITEDEAFQLLDRPTFWQLLNYLCSTLPNGDIPHCTKIHNKVLAHAVQAKSKVKAALQMCSMFACHVKYWLFHKDVKGEISFTFNTWTSEGSNNYLSITAHYVDSPKDQLDQWVLREHQLTFALLEGHHTGENIALILADVLKQYDICGKVCVLYSCHIQMLTTCSQDSSLQIMWPTTMWLSES